MKRSAGSAKAQLNLLSDPSHRTYFHEWIAEEEQKASDQAMAVARLSAEASREAAIASKKSAFWTMWAAIAAAVSATCSTGGGG